MSIRLVKLKMETIKWRPRRPPTERQKVIYVNIFWDYGVGRALKLTVERNFSVNEKGEIKTVSEDPVEEEPKRKKAKSVAPVAAKDSKSRGRPKVASTEISIPVVEGPTKCLASGDGETGQLGVGTEGENGKPRFVVINDTEDKIVAAAAGGMHSLVLSESGKVYSFGCNDDGSLGRPTKDEEDCFIPGLTPIDAKVARICAGNTHSVALTTDCRVLVWGTYRDSSGPFGIRVSDMDPIKVPSELKVPETVVDVDSGADHTVFLTAKVTSPSLFFEIPYRLSNRISLH